MCNFSILFVSTLFSTLINEFVKNNQWRFIYVIVCTVFFFLLLSVVEHYVNSVKLQHLSVLMSLSVEIHIDFANCSREQCSQCMYVCTYDIRRNDLQMLEMERNEKRQVNVCILCLKIVQKSSSMYIIIIFHTRSRLQ